MTNRYDKFPRPVPANRRWYPYPETVPYAVQLAQPIMVSIDGGTPVPVQGGNGGGSVDLTIGPTGVTPGVYGDADNYPWFEVQADGRIVDAGTFPDEGGGGVSYTQLLSGDEPPYFITNGSGVPIMVPFEL